LKKIKPIATGIDKLIFNGNCKEEISSFDPDPRIIGRNYKFVEENGVIQKKAYSLIGEHRKKTLGYIVPFFEIVYEIEKNRWIKNRFFEHKRFGRASYKEKYVLKTDFGQLYLPFIPDNPSYIPFRYELNPNKAFRNGPEFISFFNNLINTVEHIDITNLDINFDFDIDLSEYTIVCLNPMRQHKKYKNTQYYGTQQKSPARHVTYNKRLEMKEKDKTIDHLPNIYYRHELRLRDKKTIIQFFTNKKHREKILSEIVFLKEIPSINQIQSVANCTRYRAKQVLDVIKDNQSLRFMDKRSKKEVAEILQQLNEIELSMNIDTLTPFINVCKGELLNGKTLSYLLIGETIVFQTTEPQNHPPTIIKKEKVYVIETSFPVLYPENLLSGEKKGQITDFGANFTQTATILSGEISLHYSKKISQLLFSTLFFFTPYCKYEGKWSIGCRSP
jgi:hypothetical protein